MAMIDISHQRTQPFGWMKAAITVAWAATALGAYYFTGEPINAIAIAGLPLAALLCYRQPLMLCVMFVAFSFFRLHEAYPFLEPFKIPLLLGMLMFSCLALHVFVLQTVDPFMRPELKWLLIMFGLVFVGMIFAQDRAIAWGYISSTYWKVILMTFAIAWLARSDADFNAVARVIVISGTLVAAVAIYNKLNGISLVEGTRVSIGRVEVIDEYGLIDAPAELQGALSDPNDLSLVLLFPLAFAIAIAVYRSSRINVFLGVFGASAMGLAIVFTQSRGGLIGVLAVFAALGLRLIKSRTVAISLCLVAGLGLGVAMGLKGRISGGAAEISQSGGIDESARGRLDAWRAAINMATRRPLTGVGINNFTYTYYAYTDNWQRRNKAVHSSWFQVLGETGLPGLVTFILLIVATCRSALKNMRLTVAAGSPPVMTATALALVSGLAGFCAAGTFLTQAFTWPLYVLIGLTVALSQATTRLVPAQQLAIRPLPAQPRIANQRPTMRGMAPTR